MVALVASAIPAALLVLLRGGEARIGWPLLFIGCSLLGGLATVAYAGRKTAKDSSWVILGVGLGSALIILLVAYAFVVPW